MTQPAPRAPATPAPRTAAGRDLIDGPYTLAGILDFDQDRLLDAILAIEAEAAQPQPGTADWLAKRYAPRPLAVDNGPNPFDVAMDRAGYAAAQPQPESGSGSAEPDPQEQEATKE